MLPALLPATLLAPRLLGPLLIPGWIVNVKALTLLHLIAGRAQLVLGSSVALYPTPPCSGTASPALVASVGKPVRGFSVCSVST